MQEEPKGPTHKISQIWHFWLSRLYLKIMKKNERYFSWNHTYLIFSSLIIIFGNLLVAFFHTQITIVLNRQDHIISYSLLRYVDNSIISFHHHKIVQIWLTTMLKSLWFDLINFLVSWFFFWFLWLFLFCFWHFWATSHSSNLVRDLIDTTDTTENEI